MLPDDQVHPDTHVLTMVNNVIEVVNYVIAARPSLLNSVIADTGIVPPRHTGPGRRQRLILQPAERWRAELTLYSSREHTRRGWSSKYSAIRRRRNPAGASEPGHAV